MIKQLLQDYVSDLTGRNDIVIDVPPNPEMGDYSCAVASRWQ
jgi:arginyl-tRNA synthetase